MVSAPPSSIWRSESVMDDPVSASIFLENLEATDSVDLLELTKTITCPPSETVCLIIAQIGSVSGGTSTELASEKTISLL